MESSINVWRLKIQVEHHFNSSKYNENQNFLAGVENTIKKACVKVVNDKVINPVKVKTTRNGSNFVFVTFVLLLITAKF